MESSLHHVEANKVSVIIPTYNYGHFLPDTIDSVLVQSGCDLEVVVVDDGSSDDTQQVLHPYRENITYVYQDNGGLSACR